MQNSRLSLWTPAAAAAAAQQQQQQQHSRARCLSLLFFLFAFFVSTATALLQSGLHEGLSDVYLEPLQTFVIALPPPISATANSAATAAAGRAATPATPHRSPVLHAATSLDSSSEPSNGNDVTPSRSLGSPSTAAPASALRHFKSLPAAAVAGTRIFDGGLSDYERAYTDKAGVFRPYGDRVLAAFDAFGEHFELELHAEEHLFAPDAALTLDGVSLGRPNADDADAGDADSRRVRLTTFSSRFASPDDENAGFATLTLFPDGTTEGVVSRGGEIYAFLPAVQARAAANVTTGADGAFETTSAPTADATLDGDGRESGMVAYRLSDLADAHSSASDGDDADAFGGGMGCEEATPALSTLDPPSSWHTAPGGAVDTAGGTVSGAAHTLRTLSTSAGAGADAGVGAESGGIDDSFSHSDGDSSDDEFDVEIDLNGDIDSESDTDIGGDTDTNASKGADADAEALPSRARGGVHARTLQVNLLETLVERSNHRPDAWAGNAADPGHVAGTAHTGTGHHEPTPGFQRFKESREQQERWGNLPPRGSNHSAHNTNSSALKAVSASQAVSMMNSITATLQKIAGGFGAGSLTGGGGSSSSNGAGTPAMAGHTVGGGVALLSQQSQQSAAATAAAALPAALPASSASAPASSLQLPLASGLVSGTGTATAAGAPVKSQTETPSTGFGTGAGVGAWRAKASGGKRKQFAEDLLGKASRSRRAGSHLGWAAAQGGAGMGAAAVAGTKVSGPTVSAASSSSSSSSTQSYRSASSTRRTLSSSSRSSTAANPFFRTLSATAAGSGAAPVSSPAGRRLLLTEWTDCLGAGVTGTRRFHLGVAADVGFYTALNSSLATAQARISSALSQANAVFLAQLKLYVSVAEMDMRTSAGGATWNSYGRGDARATCLSTSALLEAMATWRAENHPTSRGAWLLLTNCYPPPGTVGYAYIGTSCLSKHSVGWASLSTALWRTVAHELGHIFGATHGGNGGIMDPSSDGRLGTSASVDAGEYAFDSSYSRPEMCDHLSKSLTGQNTVYSGNARLPLAQCWSALTVACGNGVVEAGEECDPPSACCTDQCRWRAGADCNTGSACCQSCRAQPTTVSCDGGEGFCAAGGVCTASVCGNYQGLTPCGMDPANPCLQRCRYQGVCRSLTGMQSSGQVLPAAVPNASPCGAPGERPTALCRTVGIAQSTCVAPRFQWVTGEYGACSRCYNGSQTRTVSCVDTDGTTSVPVSDDKCTASSRPPETQTCSYQCQYRWIVGTSSETGTDPNDAWGACTGSCGRSGGSQSRLVQCVINEEESGTDLSGSTGSGDGGVGDRTVVADSQCLASGSGAGAKPAEVRVCEVTQGCVHSWITSAWGTCSVDCGAQPGEQTRVVLCVGDGDATAATAALTAAKARADAAAAAGQADGSASPGAADADLVSAYGDVIAAFARDTALCTATAPAPPLAQQCQLSSICAFAWRASAWTGCSAACTELPGIRARVIDCVVLTQAAVAAYAPAAVPSVVPATQAGASRVRADRCAAAARPAATEPCESTAACVNRWRPEPWGNCSSDCGRGSQTRSVACVKTGAGIVIAEPPAVGVPPQWALASAGDASCTAVGSGAGTAPAAARECVNASGCGALAWFTGGWGGCSAVCTNSSGSSTAGSPTSGTGTRGRQVVCAETAIIAQASSTASASASTLGLERGGTADVGDASCLISVGAKPVAAKQCTAPWPCQFAWLASTWGTCLPLDSSVTADAADTAANAAADGACFGVQRRDVTCAATGDSASAPVPVAYCSGSSSSSSSGDSDGGDAPASERACALAGCDPTSVPPDGPGANNAAAAAAGIGAAPALAAVAAGLVGAALSWARDRDLRLALAV